MLENTATQPRLSVVCAVRNSATCIEGFLASYRRERMAESELIVIDSLSTDGTTEILRANSDIIDRLVVERDDGIYDA